MVKWNYRVSEVQNSVCASVCVCSTKTSSPQNCAINKRIGNLVVVVVVAILPGISKKFNLRITLIKWHLCFVVKTHFNESFRSSFWVVAFQISHQHFTLLFSPALFTSSVFFSLFHPLSLSSVVSLLSSKFKWI